MTGKSLGSGTWFDYATLKYNSAGTYLRVRRYNGPSNGDDMAYAIAVDASGNVYVTGGSRGSGTRLDYATIKYNSAGDTVWVRRYNGPADTIDVAYAIAVDADSNVYVTGKSYGSGTHHYDYATIKYNSAGDTVWVRRYNGPADTIDVAYAIAVDVDSNVYVTGKSYGSGTHHYDYATIKY
ncbi:MAG: SBBP repeat-containing protein, partial [candidate division WOR-3 bacterium]